MDRRIWRKIHLILLISSPHACFLFCRVEESSYELRKIKPVRKDPFAAWVEHDWSIGAEDRSIEKKKKKRSIANKRRKHGAQILKTSRRENGAMNCGGGGKRGNRCGKKCERRSVSEVWPVMLSSSIDETHRSSRDLSRACIVTLRYIFLMQSRLTNFFIINGWTMSGEIIRGVLNEQTLIFTVGKNEFDAIPSSPPFFF